MMMIECIAEIVDIISDNVPGFLEEGIVETIRARSFIIGHFQNNSINLISAEGKTKVLKIGIGHNKSLEIKLEHNINREAQPILELLKEKSTLFPLVRDHSPRGI
jgi:hypothetical protein